MDAFDQLNVHDATLKTVFFEWRDATCSLEIERLSLGTGRLQFLGVSDVHIPRALPWGPSDSINGLRQYDGNFFEIELQSGDVLVIKAESWQFIGAQTP
ncbi:MAG: hypothetical protein ACR2JA_08495 [Hydrogenophaga sp.]|uniref:hypothetical protein n=1 Tax=Hydrogenophaga sp. TaxID=1904254 RepID=UPI003D9AC181